MIADMSAVREIPPARLQRQEALARRLAGALAPGSLLTAREDLKPYECDGLSAYRETPLLAALPGDEAQVAAVLRAARCRSPTASSFRSRASTASSRSIGRPASPACSRA